MRIGLGYDIHPLEPGKKLVIGGIEIPYEMGLAGHSDADVLSHAIADALLGAAGLDDIGHHFPDTDPAYKDVLSVELLAVVARMVRAEGFEIVNIDAVVITDEPRISTHKESIVGSLASHLEMEKKRINLKGKRAEGLGSIGRKEGMAAMSVALIDNGS